MDVIKLPSGTPSSYAREQFVLRRYAEGKRNFFKANLSETFFMRADLRAISFQGAQLTMTTLDEADLRGAILTQADLTLASLMRADLRGASLEGATLTIASLNEAKLSGALLSFANLEGARLAGADLRAADLSQAILTGADLTGADLRSACLYDANMSKAKLMGANLRGVDFSYTKLDEANLEGAWLKGANIPDAVAESLKVVNNQGVVISTNAQLHMWERLRFRSKTEIKMAQALDRVRVIFWPNCLARLNDPNQSSGRANKEADFLVCYQGKWGILEVDGPYHTPTRRVEEQERERLFKFHGIRTYERFDANRCYEQPDEVVKEFLQILEMMND